MVNENLVFKEGHLCFDTEDLLIKICNPPFSFQRINEGFIMRREVGKGMKGNPTQFIFPKIIKIKPSTAGLIVGEGHLGKNFIFCNSDEKVIKEILRFLFQFNKKLHFVFEVATKNMHPNFINDSKKKWENIIKEDIESVRLRNEFNNTTEKGNIHISLYNTLFVKILKEIIEKIKIEAENHGEISKDYLRGILAAEGNINVKGTTTNCLYMVRISASKQKERDHYKKCLEKIGIKISCKDMPTISPEEGIKLGWKTDKGRAGAVIISRWENFVKVLKLGLLNLHNEKKIKFLKYFRNNKFTKQFLDFACFIKKEFTMKQAQNYFKFKGRHLKRVLTLYKKGYISRRKINRRDYVYKLTKEYMRLYNKFIEEGLIPSFQSNS